MANNCKDCKHDKGKCVGVSRAGSHRYCFEKKETTNSDRIRAMSDEELAKVPAKFGYSCVFSQKECAESDTCEKCLLEWLKQPAED